MKKMRYQRVTFTMPGRDYEKYLQGIQSNRSAFICDMIALGVASATDEKGVNQSKLVELLKENRNKEEQIKKLNLLIESLKSKLPNASDEERIAVEKFSDALDMAGFKETAGLPDGKNKKSRIIP